MAISNYIVHDQWGAQALDYNILSARSKFSVTDSCKVTVASGDLGAGNGALDVASGTVIYNGSEVSVGAQNIDLPASDQEPRKDVVYIDSNGDAQARAGFPEAAVPPGQTGLDAERPAPSDFDDTDAVVLAEVWVPGGAAAVESSNVTDRRISANTTVGTLDTTGTLSEQGDRVATRPWANNRFLTQSNADTKYLRRNTADAATGNLALQGHVSFNVNDHSVGEVYYQMTNSLNQKGFVIDSDGDTGQDDDGLLVRGGTEPSSLGDSDTILVVKGDHRVGIGTYSPDSTYILDVSGSTRFRDGFFANGSVTIQGNTDITGDVWLTGVVESKVHNGVVFAGHPSFSGLQAALDYASNNGYKCVRISEDYSANVTVPAGVTLEGAGGISTDSPTIDGGSGQAVGLEKNATIRNVDLKSNSGGSAYAIRTVYASGNNARIEDCTVRSAGSHGFYLTASFVKMSGCRSYEANIGGDAVRLNSNAQQCIVTDNLDMGAITDNGTSNIVNTNT